MKKIFSVVLSLATILCLEAQTIKAKLDAAVRQLEKDAQLKHGVIGFSVIDAATGKAVYERNAEIGLAPASTQKIFTSIAAFEYLGKNYRYKTSFIFTDRSGKILGPDENTAGGNLLIVPCGDPTLGSWRFNDTKKEKIITEILSSYKNKKIGTLFGSISMDQHNGFESQAIPDGWIWEDIGNYYGASHYDLNWNENQYDVVLDPGKNQGEDVTLRAIHPELRPEFKFSIEDLKTGIKGSGDNAFIYFEVFDKILNIRGTVPCCIDSFTISGAMEGRRIFYNEMFAAFNKNMLIDPKAKFDFQIVNQGGTDFHYVYGDMVNLYDHFSPPLDSINYYFLKRSINLYGEALIRTIAKEATGFGATEKGLEIVKDFFVRNGIEKSSINIIDGSGLSPQNRVTASSLTKALFYAKGRSWFHSFYNALPEINGMKMKSGLIGGSRSYAGFQKAANGKEYIFSIIVNNYNGSLSEMDRKLFKILDLLK